jgi:hypothetical protein
VEVLVLVPGPVLGDEREHLDLVELVDPEDPTSVLAVRAGLAAKARGEPGVAERQPVGLDDLVGVQRGERHLRRPHQEQVVLGDREHLVAGLGEEPGPEQRLLPDQHGRDHRGEPLGGEHVEGVPDEGQLEEDRLALEVGEPGARGPGGRLHVDRVVELAQLEVVPHLEVERRRFADPNRLHVVLVREAGGRRLVGEVRDLDPQGAELLVELVGLGRKQFLVLGDVRRQGDRLALLVVLEGPDLLAESLLFGSELVGAVAEAADLLVELDHAVDVEGHPALGERRSHAIGVGAEDGDVDHGVIPMGG